ncbi:MAG: hypothetical protein ABIF71_07680 [Planctomycetota bacterium]
MGILNIIFDMLFNAAKKKAVSSASDYARQDPPRSVDRASDRGSDRHAGSGGDRSRPAPTGSFKARDPLVIKYVNYKEVPRTLVAEKFSLRAKKGFISVCVEPTGKRITLKLERIQNMAEIQPVLGLLDKLPTRQEQKVLNYHMRRGTTSALFDKLKQKYPQWVQTGNK